MLMTDNEDVHSVASWRLLLCSKLHSRTWWNGIVKRSMITGHQIQRQSSVCRSLLSTQASPQSSTAASPTTSRHCLQWLFLVDEATLCIKSGQDVMLIDSVCPVNCLLCNHAVACVIYKIAVVSVYLHHASRH